ncbi:hypothetical protein PICMEDRAFT_67045 [Pichia membranifaciens NRRL Y-2026]|uniref:Uncharacterized protein n=1 Tax=Pichia membranifaciens NRRL Y-2026 TaxID=763406 RepID=A0A1E3NMQ6_9ASCO|nr:hypothetical protein PICMEDRAFT_67045 [Pichia membranifaciens NRRL Y-2026]ODQ47399.1 hypothetical protein PICMEDRAFT_67045 [Pichia membranifaciens NRRL Y-2026]
MIFSLDRAAAEVFFSFCTIICIFPNSISTISVVLVSIILHTDRAGRCSRRGSVLLLGTSCTYTYIYCFPLYR